MPLGLIASTPAPRSTPLTLPNVRMTRPARTSARFASKTCSRSSANSVTRLQCPVEVVVRRVPAQLVLDPADGRALAYGDQLDARDLGDVLEDLEWERARENGVVRAAGLQPRLCRRGEARPRSPDGPRDRQLWQVFVRRHHVDLVRNYPEARAEVQHSDDDGRPWCCREDEPHRSVARPDREGVNLAARPVGDARGADGEHVSSR